MRPILEKFNWEQFNFKEIWEQFLSNLRAILKKFESNFKEIWVRAILDQFENSFKGTWFRTIFKKFDWEQF